MWAHIDDQRSVRIRLSSPTALVRFTTQVLCGTLPPRKDPPAWVESRV